MYTQLYEAILPTINLNREIFTKPQIERGINSNERELISSQVTIVNNQFVINYKYNQRLNERWIGIVITINNHVEQEIIRLINECLSQNNLLEITDVEYQDLLQNNITRGLNCLNNLVITRNNLNQLEIHLAESL